MRSFLKNGSRRRDRLCENSEMAFWKNEKRVLGPLAAKENAPYRNCGGRFSRVAGWRGVFAQSVTSAATIFLETHFAELAIQRGLKLLQVRGRGTIAGLLWKQA